MVADLDGRMEAGKPRRESGARGGSVAPYTRRVERIDGLADVQRALLRWHERNGLRAPWRESGDPYEVLVAATMAQQTQMSRVLESYERFLTAFPTLEALASASLGDVIRVWRGMGYNTRAVRLHRAARRIADEGWPRRAHKLAQIPGIGAFTAAIIASFAFGEPAACVDTNVRRVLGRLCGDDHLAPKALQQLADHAVSRRHPASWNQALMDYGARVCVARPRCDECVVSAHCRWFREQRTDGRHVAEPRAAYRAARPRRTSPVQPYEGSVRWYRGRIIDALRETAPGQRIALDALAARIANGMEPIDGDELRALVEGLARDGLLVMYEGAGSGVEVGLPD